MKRYLAIGAGVLALLLAGWVFSWWSGRAGVERALEAGVGRLEAQGWEIAWEDREIGGFPLGYTMRLTGLTATDTTSGLALRLPWARAETHGTDRLVIRMPESFAADLPVPAPARQGEATRTAVLETAGEADGMVIVLGADGTVEVSADALSWSAEDPALGRLFQRIEALEATSLPDQTGARYRVHAALVTSEVGGSAEAEAATGTGATGATTLATLHDVAIEGSSTVTSAAAMGEMLYAGAPGQAQGSLTTGAAEVRMTGDAAAPGTLDWRADSTRGRATLTSGRMELEGETRGNSWTIAAQQPALQGQLSVALAQGFYAMPMAPTGAPDEMAVRIALQDVTADEAIWQLVDPQGGLAREPGALLVDVTGTARVTERIDQLTPGAPPPIEVSSLIFNEVAAEALGASLNATGELDILQPIGVPLGEIRVGMTGLAALVGALGRTGVIAPEMVMMADAIMQVYLRPAAGKDAWTAQIDFTRDGPMVNGIPLR